MLGKGRCCHGSPKPPEKKRDCVSDCLLEFPRLGGFSAQRIAPGKFSATSRTRRVRNLRVAEMLYSMQSVC